MNKCRIRNNKKQNPPINSEQKDKKWVSVTEIKWFDWDEQNKTDYTFQKTRYTSILSRLTGTPIIQLSICGTRSIL